jgi:hypothetical protein
MKRILVIATAIIPLLSGGAGAKAAEQPIYQSNGLPISPHQLMVLRSAHVEPRSPVPTMTLFGMPASPHQVAVLATRRKTTGIAAVQAIGNGMPLP